ncbi:hypothetical protein Lpp124_10648, partial [Lacticaseibacillus paracasei subsp. paracasei CNCM I-4649]
EHSIKISDIEKNIEKLGIDSHWELNRTHWAIKNVNLLKSLAHVNDAFQSALKSALRPMVFLSWSGEKSKRLANSFKVLLINSLGLATEQVFISDTSIGHGDDWWMKIKTALSSAKVGIVFVTADNSEKPWLNYEAGILQAKFGENNKLIPVSTSTEFPKIDGKTPLRRFQFCKQIDKQQDALQLCKTIANYLDIDPNYLNRQFKANWEEFRKSLNIVDEKYINFKKMLSFLDTAGPGSMAFRRALWGISF